MLKPNFELFQILILALHGHVEPELADAIFEQAHKEELELPEQQYRDDQTCASLPGEGKPRFFITLFYK